MTKTSLARAALPLTVLLVYLATIPGNHTEAEDAYWYARVAEDAQAHWFHPQHMLYFPIIRLFNYVIVSLGYSGRAFDALILLDIFVGALTVFLFQTFLHKRLKVEFISSLIGASLLAFSYSFWRYSMEVEIPVWTSLSSLVLLYLAFCERYTLARAFGLGVVAAVTILCHGVNALLACTIIPLRLLVRNGVWYPIAYAGSAALVLFSVYGVAYPITDEVSAMTRPLYWGGVLDPIYVLKGVISFAHGVVSGNFVWGYAPLAERLESLFASYNMTEEIFMGAMAPRWLFYASLVSLTVLCLGFIWLMVSRFATSDKGPRNSDINYLIIWCAISLLFMFLVLGPAPEFAASASVAIWSLVTVFVIDPLCRNGKTSRCVFFAVVFFLHNLVGGVAWIWSADGDYYKARSAWLLKNTGSNDLIITADKGGFTRFLRYWSGSSIVNIYNANDERLRTVEDLIGRWDGKVYIMDEVETRPRYLCFQKPGSCDRLAQFAARLETGLEEVQQSGPATIFELKAKR